MRITSKGQVTIPQEIRERAGMTPGTTVEFVLEGGKVIVRPVKGGGRGAGLVARLRGRGQARMSTDQILALTRGKR